MMAEEPPTSFRVDLTPPFRTQVLELRRRAEALGIAPLFFARLKEIVQQLEIDPVGWGDPEYRTKLEGGRVFHAILAPLIVRYAVFDARRLVFITELQALPGSPLAESPESGE